MKVYTFDSDAELLPDDWENLYSASKTSMSPTDDSDKDGLTNYQEFTLGLDPTSASYSSFMSFSSDGTSLNFTPPAATTTGYTGVTRTYILQSSTDLITWEQETQGTANGSTINFTLPTSPAHKFYRCILTVQ